MNCINRLNVLDSQWLRDKAGLDGCLNRVEGLGFRVEGLGFRVEGFRGLGLRV